MFSNCSVIIHKLLALLLLACHWNVSAAQEATDVQNFVLSALRDGVDGNSLWMINLGHPDYGDELLFVVDSTSSTQQLCATGCRGSPQDCHGHVTAETFVHAVGIIGYFRPGAIERWCLWEDGIIDSIMSRRWLKAGTISRAPTLGELTAQIDSLGPEQTCVPPAHRGVLFETMELLCFALGHKPAVIRQRQVHNPDGGHAQYALLQGVPANLFVPHTRTLLEWLVSLPQDVVWRGLSKVEWDVDPPRHDPPLEHALILSRRGTLGEHLVQLKVQDASVPPQPDKVATANYIAHVGAALGYSLEEVMNYLQTSGVVVRDYSADEDVMFDNAIRIAFTEENCVQENEEDQSCAPSNKPQRYPELDGFRSFLQSEQATHLSTRSFHQVVEPVDELFLIQFNYHG